MTAAEFFVHDDTLEVLAPEYLDLADVRQLHALLDELRTRCPRAFLLVRNGGPSLTAEVRRALTGWFTTATVPLECAVYGGGVVQRTIIEMLQRAIKYLYPGKLILGSFKTRDEAVAWISARRQLPAPTLPAA